MLGHSVGSVEDQRLLLLLYTGVLGGLPIACGPESGQSLYCTMWGVKGALLIPGNLPASEVKDLSHSLVVAAPFAHTCGLLISIAFREHFCEPTGLLATTGTKHNPPAGRCFQPLAIVT